MVYFLVFMLMALFCWALVRGGDCDPDWYDDN